MIQKFYDYALPLLTRNPLDNKVTLGIYARKDWEKLQESFDNPETSYWQTYYATGIGLSNLGDIRRLYNSTIRNHIEEKLQDRYSKLTKDIAPFSFYLSDKGNYVLEFNSIMPYLSDELFNKRLDDYKTLCKNNLEWAKEQIARAEGKVDLKPDKENELFGILDLEPARVPSKWQVIKSFKANRAAHKINYLLSRYMITSYDTRTENDYIKHASDFYLRRTRLVVNKKGEIYYLKNKKIRRLKASDIGDSQSILYRMLKYALNYFYGYNNFVDAEIRHINAASATEVMDQTRFYEYRWKNILGHFENMLSLIYPRIVNCMKSLVNDDHNSYSGPGKFAYYLIESSPDRQNLLSSLAELNALRVPKSVIKTISNGKYRSFTNLILKFDILNSLINIYKITDPNVLCYAMETSENFDLHILSRFDTIMTKSVKLYYKLLNDYYNNTNLNVGKIFIDRLRYGEVSDYNGSPMRTSSSWERDDALRMLRDCYWRRKFNHKINFKPFDNKMLKKSLVDLHEYLSKLSRSDEAMINYREYDLSLAPLYEKRVGDYQFILPRNNEEVVRLSEIMSNCVASYAKRISLNEIILYATNSKEMIDYIREDVGDAKDIANKLAKEKNYPACIELRCNGYKSRPLDVISDPGYFGNGNCRVLNALAAPEDKVEVVDLKVIQNYSLHNKRIAEAGDCSKLYEITSQYFALVNAKFTPSRGYGYDFW